MQLTNRLNRACLCACLGAHTCRRHEQRSQTSRAHDTEERAARERCSSLLPAEMAADSEAALRCLSMSAQTACVPPGDSAAANPRCPATHVHGVPATAETSPRATGRTTTPPPPTCVLCSYDSLVPWTKTRPRGGLKIPLVNLASRWTRQRREGCAGSCCRSGRATVRDHASIRISAQVEDGGTVFRQIPPAKTTLLIQQPHASVSASLSRSMQ